MPKIKFQLNQYNIPDKKLLKEWLFSRVDEATKVKYNEVIDTCFNTLLYDLGKCVTHNHPLTLLIYK